MTCETRSSPLYQYPYKRSPRNRGEIRGLKRKKKEKTNRINNGEMSPQFGRKQTYRSKNIQKPKKKKAPQMIKQKQ